MTNHLLLHLTICFKYFFMIYYYHNFKLTFIMFELIGSFILYQFIFVLIFINLLIFNLFIVVNHSININLFKIILINFKYLNNYFILFYLNFIMILSHFNLIFKNYCFKNFNFIKIFILLSLVFKFIKNYVLDCY